MYWNLWSAMFKNVKVVYHQNVMCLYFQTKRNSQELNRIKSYSVAPIKMLILMRGCEMKRQRSYLFHLRASLYTVKFMGGWRVETG